MHPKISGFDQYLYEKNLIFLFWHNYFAAKKPFFIISFTRKIPRKIPS